MAVRQKGVEALLGALLLTVLEEALITDVDSGDDSRADVVVLGKPTTERREEKVVSIWMHHPLGLGRDKDENVDGFREAGGKALLVPRPWNRAHLQADRTVQVVREFLGRLC